MAGASQPPRLWDINGAGHPSVQGYAGSASVKPGDKLPFSVRIRRQLDPGRWHGSRRHRASQTSQSEVPSEVNETAESRPRLRMDVYRLGYYGGLGARLVHSEWASDARVRQAEQQPACLRESSTLLVDCGTWRPTFRWQVPLHAVSGLYLARFVRARADPAGSLSPQYHVLRAMRTVEFGAANGDSSRSATIVMDSTRPQGDYLRTWRVDAAAGPLNPQFANAGWDYSSPPPCGSNPSARCLLRDMRNAGGARDTALRGGAGGIRGGSSASQLLEPVASHAYFVVREPSDWEADRARYRGSAPDNVCDIIDKGSRYKDTGSPAREFHHLAKVDPTTGQLRIGTQKCLRAQLLAATASSKVLVQVSDVTWRAYNYYAGPNAYGMRPHERHRWFDVPGSHGPPECVRETTGNRKVEHQNGTDCLPSDFRNASRRAFKLSLNAPLVVRDLRGINAPLGADYPAIRWLEKSGYPVAYWSGIDTHCRGRQLLARIGQSSDDAVQSGSTIPSSRNQWSQQPAAVHPPQYSAFVSLGHDEYWSERQRRWVEHARDGAGTGLQMWSGNEMYWRVRWEQGIGGRYLGADAGCKSMDVRDGPRCLCPCELQDRAVSAAAWIRNFQGDYQNFSESSGTGEKKQESWGVRRPAWESEWSLSCSMRAMQPPAPDDLAAHRGLGLRLNTAEDSSTGVKGWYREELYAGNGLPSAGVGFVLQEEAICNPRTLAVYKETASMERLGAVKETTISPHRRGSTDRRSPPAPADGMWQHRGWTGTFRDDSSHRHNSTPLAALFIENQNSTDSISIDRLSQRPRGQCKWNPGMPARPEQSLTGQSWRVNAYRNDHLELPATEGTLAPWKGSDASALLLSACAESGLQNSTTTVVSGCAATAVLPKGILGHEWDVDEDRAARPAGIARLSRTTLHSVLGLTDNGATFDTQSATHRLVMYRAAGPPWMCQMLHLHGSNTSIHFEELTWKERCKPFTRGAGDPSSQGALVFGAGTVQFSWGLDPVHDRPTGAPTFAESDVNARIGVDQNGADQSIQTLSANIFAMQGISGWLDLHRNGGTCSRAEVQSTVKRSSRHTASASAGILLLPATQNSHVMTFQGTNELEHDDEGSADNHTFRLRADAVLSRAMQSSRSVVVFIRACTNNKGPAVAGVEVSLDGGSRWHAADRARHAMENPALSAQARLAIARVACNLEHNAEGDHSECRACPEAKLRDPLDTQLSPICGTGGDASFERGASIPETASYGTWLFPVSNSTPTCNEASSKNYPGHGGSGRNRIGRSPSVTDVEGPCGSHLAGSLWAMELTLAELAMDILEMTDLEARWRKAGGIGMVSKADDRHSSVGLVGDRECLLEVLSAGLDDGQLETADAVKTVESKCRRRFVVSSRAVGDRGEALDSTSGV